MKAYRIHTSVDVHFAHHIRGHQGPCVNIHGHTWKLEVGLTASELDKQGFVVDFDELDTRVLSPCFRLLDHAMAIGEETFGDVAGELEQIGVKLVKSRVAVHGESKITAPQATKLHGAENRFPGGIKVAVFPFSPTSERLARWLYEAAESQVGNERVGVAYARVYETLRPVEQMAEYAP